LSKIFYVNNLAQSINLAELESLFTMVGDVESFRVETHPQPYKTTSIGVVEMATEQQAADCIERFHGQSALGQTLSVVADKLKYRLEGVKPVALPLRKRKKAR